MGLGEGILWGGYSGGIIFRLNDFDWLLPSGSIYKIAASQQWTRRIKTQHKSGSPDAVGLDQCFVNFSLYCMIDGFEDYILAIEWNQIDSVFTFRYRVTLALARTSRHYNVWFKQQLNVLHFLPRSLVSSKNSLNGKPSCINGDPVCFNRLMLVEYKRVFHSPCPTDGRRVCPL